MNSYPLESGSPLSWGSRSTVGRFSKRGGPDGNQRACRNPETSEHQWTCWTCASSSLIRSFRRFSSLINASFGNGRFRSSAIRCSRPACLDSRALICDSSMRQPPQGHQLRPTPAAGSLQERMGRRFAPAWTCRPRLVRAGALSCSHNRRILQACLRRYVQSARLCVFRLQRSVNA